MPKSANPCASRWASVSSGCATKCETCLKRAAVTHPKDNAVRKPSASAGEKRGMARSATATCVVIAIVPAMPIARVMRTVPAMQIARETPIDQGMPIARVMRAIGAPNGLVGVGYGEGDLDALVEGAAPQRRLLDNAPVAMTRPVLRALFAGALSCW